MSIEPDNNVNETLVKRFAAELDQVADADAAIQRMPEPRIPSGGRTEEWVKPRLAQVNTLRDTARIWSPAIVATAVFVVLVVSPLPLTGPLLVYALGWLGFGIWTAAGRPSLAESARLAGRAAVTIGRAIATAALAVAHIVRRGAHVVRVPVRRRAEAV
ncbi:hypothetical protein [Nocardia africana]